MKTYNTVIVGGGASGILSGIYLDDKNSIILEKNDILGKKILLTGGGRCNLTNNATKKEYMKSYYNSGKYYIDAFNTFFNEDIRQLLKDNGCNTKVEEDNRVFPVSDKASDVVNTLTKILKNTSTKYRLNSYVTSISYNEGLFKIKYNNNVIQSKNLILATGGTSYPKTGSDGDGIVFTTSLGHTKPKNMGGLCPIKVEETWPRKLQGITNYVSIEIKANKKSIVKDSGSIIFTHNGLSGFIILDNSMIVEKHLRKNQDVIINLDFVSDYSYESLDKTLQEDFSNNSNKTLKTYLHKYLPKNMAIVFLENIKIDSNKILNKVTKKERIKIRDNLKKTTLTITSVLENESMVTNSGVKQKEINPATYESKIVPNLYIVGELVEGCGICGGYNLQKAFSTGVLAAKTIRDKYYDSY